MMDTRAGKLNKARREYSRRGGFTLIEILVALGIFVIGALAIVRIFPPALGVIQNSENRSIATNLSRGTLASYENDTNLIPDGVYDTDLAFEDAAFVGSITTNTSLPTILQETSSAPNAPGVLESALGHFKRIQGERQRVLVDTTPDPDQLYVLTQFPYNWGNDNTVLIYVEDRVEGVRAYTSDASKLPLDPPYVSGRLDFSNARLASDGRDFNDVDYRLPDGTTGSRGTDRKLPPNEWGINPANVLYYATYNWIDNGRVQGVVDEPVARDLPTLKLYLKAASIDGPISLRVRRLVGSYNPGTAAADSALRADAMRGYLPLNFAVPADLARNSNLIYPSVSLTYNVSDWRWMVEDTVITSGSGDYTDVAVPTRFIDAENLNSNLTSNQAGNGSVFTLTADLPNNNTPPPTAAISSRARWDGADPTAIDGDGLVGDPDDDDKMVNAKRGLVHFDNDGGGSRRARVVYWTIDQWARQLAVAAKSYVPWRSGGILNDNFDDREEWREYFWEGPPGTQAERGSLYFRPSEAGKTVIVSFEYWGDTDGDGTNDAFLLKTAPMTIEDETVTPPPLFVDTDFSNSKVARLQFADPSSSGGGNLDVRAIRSVRGASVMVRTAWADGGRYQQEVASTYRPLDEN